MVLSHIEIIKRLELIEKFGDVLEKPMILHHIHNLRLRIIDRPVVKKDARTYYIQHILNQDKARKQAWNLIENQL